MPIEFSCPKCLHPQQVDESKIGQQVYCKVCYFKLTVPAESTNKPVDESQLYTLDAKPWDIQDRQELIPFPCDICKTIISVREEQIGEEITCAKKKKKIIVPKSIAEIAKVRRIKKLDKVIGLARYKETYSLRDGSAVPTDDVPAENRSKQIRFFCSLCRTALFATEDQVGTLITCPDCTTKTEVPPPLKSKTSPLPPPSAFEGDTSYKIVTSSSVAPKDNLVPVVCHFCGTRMYADESQIGQSKTCPDCGKQTEIKAAPKPRKITTETTSADAYGLKNASETAPRPVVTFFGSLPSALLRKRQNEWESSRSLNRPPLPKRPLTERFFVPFGSLSMWFPLMLFVAVVPLGAVGIYWAASATEGGGKVGAFGFAIFTMFFGFTVFLVFIAAFSYFATFLLHLFSLTNSGMDDGEFKGEVAPSDYFINGFWLFMFSVIAAVPGFLVGHYLYPSPEFTYVMMRVSHWLFFPICILSSLEAGSMFAVFTKNILASLFRMAFAWFRFYVLTGMLFVSADLCLMTVASSNSDGSLSPVLLALLFFLFGIQSLFFFRLLGRLAWLIEETYRQKCELEEENE
ncbi:MAG: hypothetical protein LBI05_02140 [Planctomycetaceae bacterium]|jgi:DNA-directed RNA polymerase subunit M/transcription elongation factor TFIIS|nr:hypothetical protein [Planctomycetaceae bacterium]